MSRAAELQKTVFTDRAFQRDDDRDDELEALLIQATDYITEYVCGGRSFFRDPVASSVDCHDGGAVDLRDMHRELSRYPRVAEIKRYDWRYSPCRYWRSGEAPPAFRTVQDLVDYLEKMSQTTSASS